MSDYYTYRAIARDDLIRYRDAQKEIEHLKEKIDRQQAKAESVTRVPDPDTVGIQMQSKGPEELLCTIADMQVEYKNKLLAAELICREIEKRISIWTCGIERRILRDCYLFGVKLKNMKHENYSYVQIRRFHCRALDNYGEKMSSNEL